MNDNKGDHNAFIKCMQNCFYLETDVGEKESRFRSMQAELKNIVKSKDRMESEIRDLCMKIKRLDVKSPDFTLDEFREVCFLKHSLHKKIQEKKDANRQSALLTRESNSIKKQIYKETNEYKSFIYQKEKLLPKSGVNGTFYLRKAYIKK